jgi:hypothetical protein
MGLLWSPERQKALDDLLGPELTASDLQPAVVVVLSGQMCENHVTEILAWERLARDLPANRLHGQPAGPNPHLSTECALSESPIDGAANSGER